MEELTQIKRGEFKIEYKNELNPNRCGSLEDRKYYYKIEIKSRIEELSEKGFLVDNDLIDEYFKGFLSIEKDIKSCEMVCYSICRDMQNYFIINNKLFYSIEVTISNSENFEREFKYKIING